ncbi:bromodomain-containing protein 3-like [Daphnia pulicaria]|uniref:bromodomain-containing protein 3-like n=1 Tax=Daphnia pulicaria TaxID=35523 RepID=UPI001EEA7BFA|nr:bromodomain-containing protein 3-like [Daphnia pulicaria]XP_046656578.1 bromodomain-containing protein 3-like [Daphnia pulicaria]
MANLSTHHMVSTTEGTETWNSRLNFSTQECQMNYNLSNNQTKQQNSQTKDGFTTYYVLSSGELSSSSTESQVKKKEMQERRRKKKEKKLVREERRRKKEEKRKKEERRRKEEKRRKKEGRRRKGNIKKHAENFNLTSPAYKRVKRANASERFARNAHDDSKFKDIATWVALKATRTQLIDDAWVAPSSLNSQNGEVTNDLYEAISSDEDSLLDFTPTPSEANLTLPSNDQSESEVVGSVKKLSREELEKVAIRHIAMCEKYTKTELELDICKGREETFHSMILELNQEVIKLKSMIPPSKTTRSIGVQMQLHSSSGQQNSSSIPYPFQTRIKIEQVEGNSDKESIALNEICSNNLHTHPSFFGSSVLRTPVSSVNGNQIHSVIKQEKS